MNNWGIKEKKNRESFEHNPPRPSLASPRTPVRDFTTKIQDAELNINPGKSGRVGRYGILGECLTLLASGSDLTCRVLLTIKVEKNRVAKKPCTSRCSTA